jgi:hypothetical protein
MAGRKLTSKGGKVRSVWPWLAGAGTILAAIVAWVVFRPVAGDKLCAFVQQKAFHCPALVADPLTLRPGGIVRELPDQADSRLTRFELPHAYLDNESCLIPGARLEPWSPREEQSFQLDTIRYDFDFVARMGGKLRLPAVQGVEVDAKAAASRVSRISIAFGPARSRLLDENVLLNRIESCEISPRCIDRIRQQGYKVLNRVLEVEGISYSFEDSQGVKIPLGVLVDGKVVRDVRGAFDLSQRNASTLDSKARMVIGVSPISSAALSAAKPCTDAVVYSFEGSSRAVVGGGGRPGHITPRAPVEAVLGGRAEQVARGTEDTQGNFERTASSAKSVASVTKVDSDALKVVSSVAIQGGHYGVRGPLGIGIVSGHDTSANAQASADGRINILLRRPEADLVVAWEGFPTSSGSGGVQYQATIQIMGPSGLVDEISAPVGSGERKVRLPAEGQYGLVVRTFARAEGSGHAARASRAIEAIVRARVKL